MLGNISTICFFDLGTFRIVIVDRIANRAEHDPALHDAVLVDVTVELTHHRDLVPPSATSNGSTAHGLSKRPDNTSLSASRIGRFHFWLMLQRR